MTSPRQIRALARRQKVIELRLSGMTFEAIAKEISARADEYNTTEGSYLHQHAYRDLRLELAQMRQVSMEEREEARQLEVSRLDVMLKKLWDEYEEASVSTMSKMAGETQGPALWIIDRILKIQDRRAKYLGLDAPTKHSMTFDESSIQVIVSKLLGILETHVKDTTVLSLIAKDLSAIDWLAANPAPLALVGGDENSVLD